MEPGEAIAPTGGAEPTSGDAATAAFADFALGEVVTADFADYALTQLAAAEAVGKGSEEATPPSTAAEGTTDATPGVDAAGGETENAQAAVLALAAMEKEVLEPLVTEAARRNSKEEEEAAAKAAAQTKALADAEAAALAAAEEVARAKAEVAKAEAEAKKLVELAAKISEWQKSDHETLRFTSEPNLGVMFTVDPLPVGMAICGLHSADSDDLLQAMDTARTYVHTEGTRLVRAMAGKSILGGIDEEANNFVPTLPDTLPGALLSKGGAAKGSPRAMSKDDKDGGGGKTPKGGVKAGAKDGKEASSKPGDVTTRGKEGLPVAGSEGADAGAPTDSTVSSIAGVKPSPINTGTSPSSPHSPSKGTLSPGKLDAAARLAGMRGSPGGGSPEPMRPDGGSPMGLHSGGSPQSGQPTPWAVSRMMMMAHSNNNSPAEKPEKPAISPAKAALMKKQQELIERAKRAKERADEESKREAERSAKQAAERKAARERAAQQRASGLAGASGGSPLEKLRGGASLLAKAQSAQALLEGGTASVLLAAGADPMTLAEGAADLAETWPPPTSKDKSIGSGYGMEKAPKLRKRAKSPDRKAKKKEKEKKDEVVAVVVRPDSDIKLEQLLHQLLWHRQTGAVELTASDTDDPAWMMLDMTEGWLPLAAAVEALNGPEIRSTVASAATALATHVYKPEEVVTVIQNDEAQRFEVSADGASIRKLLVRKPRVSAEHAEGEDGGADDHGETAGAPGEEPAGGWGELRNSFKLRRAARQSREEVAVPRSHPLVPVLNLKSLLKAGPGLSALLEVDDALEQRRVVMGTADDEEEKEIDESHLRKRADESSTHAWYLLPAGPIAGGRNNPTVVMSENVPELAVFGWFAEQLPSILAGGLTRVSRHHTPLTRRQTARGGVDCFLWIDVHHAMEKGIRFFQSRRCAQAYHGKPTSARASLPSVWIMP